MNATLWTCPVCSHALERIDKQFRCQQGHGYDIAREGYANLLLAHQRHSASPGDDKQMLRNRREFLEQGYYQTLAERLALLVSEDCQQRDIPEYRFLDSGCGEGYYTGLIAQALDEKCQEKRLQLGGTDIAKDAIRMAAKRYPAIDFAVASNTALPVADHSLDCLLRVFAPGSDSEVARVLKAGGLFISVTPGPRHLYALRELVYDQPREHAADIPVIEGLSHSQRSQLDFHLQIQGGDIARLLAMTPYYWQASEEKQAHIAALASLDTEVSFQVDLYRRAAIPASEEPAEDGWARFQKKPG